MSTFSGWKPSDYIKEAAMKGASRYHWRHPNHFTRASFNTIVHLKAAGKLNPNHLEHASRIMESHSHIFMLLGMYYVREGIEGKKIDYLTQKEDGYLLKLSGDIFAVSFEKFMFDIADTGSDQQIQAIRRIVDSIQYISTVYCWLFLSLAKKDDILKDLNEELYLLQEINAFTKRKEKE